MLTLYTAVGSLQFVNVNGKPVPHVINNQKEYGMSKEEASGVELPGLPDPDLSGTGASV